MTIRSPAGGAHQDPTLDSEQDGARLLARHAAGDREAFDLFVRLHAQRAFRLAVRLTGQRSDAEDATQSAFILAYQRTASFQPGTSARAWFGGIVVNCCHQLRRRERRLTDRHRRAQDALATPLDAPCDQEDHDLIAAELAALEEPDRLALWLRHGEGLRYREIAQRLRVPQKTVESRVQRTIAHLRARLLARERRAGRPGGMFGGLIAYLPVLPRPGLADRACRALTGRTAPSAVPATSAAGSVHPGAQAGLGRTVRWLPPALPTVAVAAAVLAGLAARAAWPDPAPAALAGAHARSQRVIDHDDLFDPGRRLMHAYDAGGNRSAGYFGCTISIYAVEGALLEHFALFPPGAGEAVVTASQVAPLLEAWEHGDARVRLMECPGLACFPDQSVTAARVFHHDYVHDYHLLPDRADPTVASFNWGFAATLRGQISGDRVRLVQADYEGVELTRIASSAFQRERGIGAGRRETTTYAVEEPEIEQRLAVLSQPVLLGQDDALLMLVPPAELHRLRAPVARSQGAIPTGDVDISHMGTGDKFDANSSQALVLVRAKVVNVPAEDPAPATPAGITQR